MRTFKENVENLKRRAEAKATELQDKIVEHMNASLGIDWSTERNLQDLAANQHYRFYIDGVLESLEHNTEETILDRLTNNFLYRIKYEAEKIDDKARQRGAREILTQILWCVDAEVSKAWRTKNAAVASLLF